MIGDRAKAALVRIRIDRFRKDVDGIAESLRTGRITLNMWQEEMKLLLRQLHTGATAIGVGGWEQATSRDWGKVGPILKEQYRYLQGFARAIYDKRDTISLAAIQARAHLYGEKAAYTANIAQAGEIAGLLRWIPRDGSTLCLNNCLCQWVFSEIGRDAGMKTIQATWTLNPAEHCATCIERDGFTTTFTVPEDTKVPPFIGGGHFKEKGPGRGWWGPPRGTHGAGQRIAYADLQVSLVQGGSPDVAAYVEVDETWEGPRRGIAEMALNDMAHSNHPGIVFRHQGEVVGVASFDLSIKDGLYLEGFATKRPGVGRSAMLHIAGVAMAKGKKLLLHSVPSATGFYKKVGLKEVGEHHLFEWTQAEMAEATKLKEAIIDDEPEDGVFCTPLEKAKQEIAKPETSKPPALHK
jgi:hypothetical protein